MSHRHLAALFTLRGNLVGDGWRRRGSAWADGGRKGGQEGLSLNLYRHSQAEQGAGGGGECSQTSASLFDWVSSHLLVKALQCEFPDSQSLDQKHEGWRIRATVAWKHGVSSVVYGVAEVHSLMQ